MPKTALQMICVAALALVIGCSNDRVVGGARVSCSQLSSNAQQPSIVLAIDGSSYGKIVVSHSTTPLPGASDGSVAAEVRAGDVTEGCAFQNGIRFSIPDRFAKETITLVVADTYQVSVEDGAGNRVKDFRAPARGRPTETHTPER